MKYYPVFLDLRERCCVIVGGGEVAERKALSLLEAGADVTVVSPGLSLKLKELSSSGKITHQARPFGEHDLTGAYLVIAATDSAEVNTAVGRLCRKKHVLVNVAAPPDEGNFIVPSVVDRGALVIAVSTSGASPAMASKIRSELEERYGPEYEEFLEKMTQLRHLLMDHVPDEPGRRSLFQALVDSDVLDLLRRGRTHEADQRISQITGLRMK
jgi:precorrin-2 dehydrogenase/sirohydrochlorin ferrochelatase